MAFDIATTLITVRNKIQDNNRAERCEIGHKLALPTEETYAAVTIESATIVETTLDGSIGLHVVNIKLYQQALGQDLESVELNLAKQAELIIEDLLTDFDLGGTIRNVDAGGIYGVSPSAQFEWIEETRYHAVDITIPLIVDDSITLAA